MLLYIDVVVKLFHQNLGSENTSSSSGKDTSYVVMKRRIGIDV